MFKTALFLLLFTFSIEGVKAQCVTAPAAPDCNGTEPYVTDNETLVSGVTKWYYGGATTMNSLTLDGGTLVVCGDLTVDKFYINSGKIFVRPGGRFVIGSGIGEGLIFKGDCYIYNYGICEIQRNLSFDAGATAATPNVVINASPTSVFKMSNQYFVINAPHSWFVNRGTAEFWGIINDPFSVPGSVCLGDGSSTRMAVLINKVADTYVVPAGTACVSVFQFSQFSNRLTDTPNLYICLGNSHSSFSGCGGCPANNWGLAQVFTGCAGCDAITVLGTDFTSFNAIQTAEGNRLDWEINAAVPGSHCRILRSANGTIFQLIDSMQIRDAGASAFTTIDKNPIPGNNYYMINYTEPGGMSFNSKAVKVIAQSNHAFNIYPTPFRKHFFIQYGGKIEQVILTDMMGRNIPIRTSRHEGTSQLLVELMDQVTPGVYIVHLRTATNVMARTLLKE